ncbi:class I SAM-dependent methyltransferase [Sphaerisporangium melleum]|uniref:Class I SAM-dependent methyltransferase n=1 Tax=Sphaerisporangium melleum TaxID=321316 RepID=A0A917VKU8_9ACTN|nr:class I SAM-dependent methyltransferase [Sphaerisporangium melleum]GGK94377.1 class I SAM-dependent methyltransferase [Sphaerisporangium melleum]GII73237.1 class I SAM-dependent methyltransferase [Sphaerisporangium melleum]
MIDELAYAGPEHLDPAFIAGYDRKQGYPDPTEDLTVLGELGVAEDSTVVDLAAGTGQFALPAARRFRRVVAVDVSPAMQDFLRRRAADAGVSNIDVVRAGFLSYEHDGPPVDAVHTRNALHQLPDFFKAIALDRISRLLRPGGVLRLHDLIYDFAPSEAEAVFGRWFAGAASDPAAGYTAEDYAVHIRTEFSTFRWLLEPMIAAAGLEIVRSAFHRSLYGTYTCVKR